MQEIASRLKTQFPSLARPAALAAATCFGAAVACSFSVRDVVGALARPCDPASRTPRVILALPELSRSPFNPRFEPAGCVLVSGFWMQNDRREVEMRVVADGAASLSVDGKLVAERKAEGPGRTASGRVLLDAGPRQFEMKFQPEGFAQLRGVLVGEDGARNLGPTFLRPPAPWEYLAERASRILLLLSAVFVSFAMAVCVLSRDRWTPIFAIALLALVLRFEALIAVFGQGLPGAVAKNLFALGHALRPDTWVWEKSLVPYQGGDPIRYIEFARQMRGFFDAHVREPLFVAWSRLFIVDFGLGDFGISVATMLASCLLVAATFVFARALFGQAIAVIAAILLAIDPAEIGLSVEGWRDGAFAASFVLALWALERARLDPSPAKSAVVGVILGGSCLLRLSALSYAAPAIVGLAMFGCAPRPRRLAAAGVALVVTAILVGPYLVSCAIAYGDPLIAVNYHLRFYRPSAVGSATSAATTYVFSLQDLWGRADMLFDGLTSYPFLSKWWALELWFGSATSVITIASVLGLIGWTASPTGRRILLMTAFALVPFSFTWMVPGGSAYRFTLFAYPVYLVAAAWFAVRSTDMLKDPTAAKRVVRPAGTAVVGSVVVALLGVALRHSRTVADGEAAREFTVSGGPRDSLSASGFGLPRYGDGGFVRTSLNTRRILKVVLQPDRPWLLTLRFRDGGSGRILEDGSVVAELPATSGTDPEERTMRLPVSTKTHRSFEITGAGSFEFVSARFAPGPAGE
jgi:hypothetical protein